AAPSGFACPSSATAAAQAAKTRGISPRPKEPVSSSRNLRKPSCIVVRRQTRRTSSRPAVSLGERIRPCSWKINQSFALAKLPRQLSFKARYGKMQRVLHVLQRPGLFRVFGGSLSPRKVEAGIAPASTSVLRRRVGSPRGVPPRRFASRQVRFSRCSHCVG